MTVNSTQAHKSTAQSGAPQSTTSDNPVNAAQSDTMSAAATVGIVVAGAAIMEAALIPAILIGAAAALAPRFLPRIGIRIQPVVDSTVRGAVKMGRRARNAVGEAQERIGDISAEVAAEEAASAVA